MDIKKADPTQRLRESSQESQQTKQPKLYPKGFTEVDAFEEVKQLNAFEQATAGSEQESKRVKGDPLAGFRIGNDPDGLLATLEDVLDSIPSLGLDQEERQSILDYLFEVLSPGSDQSDPRPTTTVESDRVEKLKDLKLQLNEIRDRARVNNPLAGHEEDIIANIAPEEPSTPVKPGDGLTGQRIGDDTDDLLNALEDVLDNLPAFLDEDARQKILNAFLDKLRPGSSSDQESSNAPTPTTSVRQDQINRVRASVNQRLITEDEKK